MRERGNESGVSYLLEYLLLIGILSLFIVVTSLYLKDTLENAQVEQVLQNQASDTASVVASQLTDYMILSEHARKISSKIPMTKSVGGVEFTAELRSSGGKAYVVIKDESGREVTKIPLGDESTIGFKVINSSVHSMEEEKSLTFNKSVVCDVPIDVSLEIKPGAASFTTSTSNELINHTITIRKLQDKTPIEANWTLYLWNGSVYSGYGDTNILQTRYHWPGDNPTDWSGTNCTYNSTEKTAICTVRVYAELKDTPQCNDTTNVTVILSKKPEEVEPFMEYSKFAKPSIVSLGDTAEVHIVLEGKGFLKEQADLSVVQVLDVSGSMEWESEYQSIDDSVTQINYWVEKFEINTSDVGKTLHIRAWTTDSDITNLTDWYSTVCVDWCTFWEWVFGQCSPLGSCQVYSNYKDEYVKVYLDDVDIGGVIGDAYTEPYGKDYIKTIDAGDLGNHTIKILARAPEPITLHLLVEIGSNKVIDKSTDYQSTLLIHNIILPSGRTQNDEYEYLKVKANTQLFDAWLESPSGSKQMFEQGKNRAWVNDSDVPAGTYRIYTIPIDSTSNFFTAKAYTSRLDAAKVASIYFNNLAGIKYVGLARFSTDAYSYKLNSSSTVLPYLTTDKSKATDEIKKLDHNGATDHYDGLYAGYVEFPNETVSGNNCTECLENTIPLLILLSDGETTICDSGYVDSQYYNCNSCDGSDYCDVGAEKAEHMANIIKNTEIIPGNEMSKIKICTIGFGTDLSSNGQEFLKDIASPRPDNGQPCYFFAQNYDELTEAFEAIYKAFRIAAKNVTVMDTVNNSITINPNLQYVDGSLRIYLNGEDKTSEFSHNVNNTPDGTRINVSIKGVAIEDKIEIVFKVKPLKEGSYSLNVESKSYITYEKYPFGPSNKVTEGLGSATLTVKKGSQAKVELG
ncbi:vWA domain-containing protein [Archaeoglobus sp.]